MTSIAGFICLRAIAAKVLELFRSLEKPPLAELPFFVSCLGRVLINRDRWERPNNVRFGSLCGLKSDIVTCPKSAILRPEQLQHLAVGRAFLAFVW
jgi:hypothetical protein